MKPKTLSASAINVFLLCPARYKVEILDRTPTEKSPAASLGTTLHAVLEEFVQNTRLGQADWTVDELLRIYVRKFFEIFGPDNSSQEFKDGQSILRKWFNDPGIFDGVIVREILSYEKKLSFMVPSPYGQIPVNYIIDRLDKLPDGRLCVVDYKSSRIPLTPEDLAKKIQARLYALAVAIQYKGEGNTQEFVVEFDFLRYTRIAVTFTREDNAEFWRLLKKIVVEICNTSDTNPPERINPECAFCIRKASCKTLQRNISAGGLASLGVDEQVDLLGDIQYRIKALSNLKDELERMLFRFAATNDLLEITSSTRIAELKSSSRRQVDYQLASSILGPERTAKYGPLTLSTLDNLLANDNNDLTFTERNQLKKAITRKTGDMKIKVKDL